MSKEWVYQEGRYIRGGGVGMSRRWVYPGMGYQREWMWVCPKGWAFQGVKYTNGGYTRLEGWVYQEGSIPEGEDGVPRGGCTRVQAGIPGQE